MKGKITLMTTALLMGLSVCAQPAESDLQKANKNIPHKFKELKTGTTLEVVREKTDVKIYMLIDDIDQYEQILVERSDEMQLNYSQCKVIEVTKGKYKNNYVELVDHYPLSPKMSNLYRIKTVTPDGIMRMYAPVPIIRAEEVNAKN